MIGATGSYAWNYSFLSLIRVSLTIVSKGYYTPIGDTGIPPKQILEQVIEDTPINWDV